MKRNVTCDYCGDVMLGWNRDSRRFCSGACRAKAREARFRNALTDQACAACGSRLSHYHLIHNQKYCNRGCYAASMRLHEHNRSTCAACGEPLKTGALFCSHSCAGKVKAMSGRNAEMCALYEHGATLDVIALQFNVTRQRIQQIVARERPDLLYSKRSKEVTPALTRYCAVCGTAFCGRRLKYCSDDCYRKTLRSRSQYVITKHHKTCPVCNERFTTRYDHQVHCSHSCARYLALQKKYGSDYALFDRDEILRRKREYARAHYASNDQYRNNKKQRQAVRARERWATDAAYREKRNRIKREKYATDKGFREREQERVRERRTNKRVVSDAHQP